MARQTATASSEMRLSLPASEGEIVSTFPTVDLNGRLFRFAATASREAAELNHGIHKYPAKFIPHIPRWAMDYAALRAGDAVLDPFCGSGTTLVEGMVRGLRVAGADISPLARLIARAKCGIWSQSLNATLGQLADLELKVRIRDPKVALSDNGETLHETWSFWFPEFSMGRLLSIKEAISESKFGESDVESDSIKSFLLVLLSETAKRVSYLDERQIKVRYYGDKFPNGIPDALDVFLSLAAKFIPRQQEVSRQIRGSGGALLGIWDDARALPRVSRKYDAAICSPPYINAIDYTMAHKYNLFLLGLVAPADFKQHCRQYIGVTERAVTKQMIAKIPSTGHDAVDGFVAELASGSAVDKNRAYIVASYFADMRQTFQQVRESLKLDALYILALGHANRIRGRIVQTAELLTEIAEQEGFSLVENFFHGVERRRIKFQRNVTAGIIHHESVIILRRNV